MKDIYWVDTGCNLPLEAFTPNPKNPKKHTKKQMEHIKKSILDFGFDDPIAVWGDENIIVEGHGRVKALRQLVDAGEITLPENGVPCIRLDHMTKAERDAYMTEHNHATMETSFDDEILADLLKDLEHNGINMEAFGIEMPNAEQAEVEPEIEFTEELREEHNYVVLYFDNEVDWLQAETLFDIKPKLNLPTSKDGQLKRNFQHKSVGRVLNGAKALERILKYEHLS